MSPLLLSLGLVLIFVLVCPNTRVSGDVAGGDCHNVATSEGVRTMKHGDRACDSLQPGETAADKGKRFLVCNHGNTALQHCPGGLRFDTASNTCNWPSAATCALPDQVSGTPIPNPTTQSPQSTPRPTTPRPTTQRPTTPRPTTPRPTVPAGPCNSSTCTLPNCFCYGNSPSGIPLNDMPMFVMLTFDDAVSHHFYNNYFRALLHDNDFSLFNPTGCQIKAALYVSHVDTDYSLVKALWEKGHEIGSHTINHRLPQGNDNSDYPEMVAEIQGLKEEVLSATNDQTLVDSIIGFRAPYLRVAGDVMYDVLRDFGFLYDTSILNIEILQGRQPQWPFTLDYVVPRCANPPCPTKPYPGMWEVPLNGWIGDDGQGCSMADACTVGTSAYSATEQQWYNYFNRNFQDYFYPIKVPMPIFIHGWIFGNAPNSYPALTRFLQDLMQNNGNVWMVTPKQLIQWMQNPLSHSQMVSQNFGC